ncbi:MAG TPA: ABC transporter permease [Candidatus Methylomirabilis sp.]|nr:ABC transporter permease [Candidatus Methylomirabilis sp.]
MKFWGNWRKRDQELQKEIQHHLGMAAADRVERGASMRDAQSEARREFGNVGLAKETARDVWGWRWLENLHEDLRYGIRTLRKQPAFAIIAVLTLALGIGANTAIFSFIDAALLKAIPVRDADQLVLLQWKAHKNPQHRSMSTYGDCQTTLEQTGAFGCSLSEPFFREVLKKDDIFSSAAAFLGADRLNLSGMGDASVVDQAEYVTGAYFETLRIKPAIGRLIGREDDTASAASVVVLSYRFWRSRFGGSKDVLGKTVLLNRVPFAIIGVAEEPFDSLSPGNQYDMWLPLATESHLQVPWDNRDIDPAYWRVVIVGRLKPATAIGTASAELTTLFRNEATHGRGGLPMFTPQDEASIVLKPLDQGLTGVRTDAAPPLYALMLVVGLVLLIACANVAGLMLARATSRQREMAVRFALGASKSRILRQLLTESLMLSCVGGAVGILFASWCVAAIQNFLGSTTDGPLPFTATINTNVLFFTAAVAILTGVLFGLAPALRGMRVDLTPALKEGAGSSSQLSRAKRGWFTAGNSLVIAQVALSIVVLAGAGLLIRTLENLKNVNPGFDTRNVLTFTMDPTLIGYKTSDSDHFYSELQQRLANLPGVMSVSYSWRALLGSGLWTTSFHLEGAPKDEEKDADVLPIGPEFFHTMRIPFLAGREFGPADFARAQMLSAAQEKFSAERAAKLKAGASPADIDKIPSEDLPPTPAIVNQAFVRKYLPNINPVGHIFGAYPGDPAKGEEKSAGWEIAGVVGDAKYNQLRRDIQPTIYIPNSGGSVSFAVRTATGPAKFVPQIRAVVNQLDSNLPVFEIHTETEQIARKIFLERLVARLSGFFGGLALLLACIGLYGLIAYEVARRTREIGIRSALGAARRDVLRLVLTQGMRLAIAGAVVGTGLALALMRLAQQNAQQMLFGVKAVDPVTLLCVLSLLFSVTLLACLVPARRATKVDPVVALRYE